MKTKNNDQETMKTRNSIGWLLSAGLLLFLGLFTFISAVNTQAVPNEQYLTMTDFERLSHVSQDSFIVSYYGGLGFILSGFICTGVGIYVKYYF